MEMADFVILNQQLDSIINKLDEYAFRHLKSSNENDYTYYPDRAECDTETACEMFRVEQLLRTFKHELHKQLK